MKNAHYHGLAVGLLVLAFKLVVIIPVLTALNAYLKHRVGGLDEASILPVLRFYGIATVMTVAFFTAISAALSIRSWLTPQMQESVLRWLDFYSWEAFNVIPGLNATQTLQWNQPIPYGDWRVGSLVLAFKLAFIVLALVAAKRYLTADSTAGVQSGGGIELAIGSTATEPLEDGGEGTNEGRVP